MKTEDNNMKIQSVSDDAFRTYGRVVDGYDYKLLLERLEDTTPKPADSVIYVPSDAGLEDTPAYAQLRDNCYGGMPIQIGYCNGTNTKLNCFEYHRDSEIDIAADDAILLVARQQDIIDGRIDSSKTEAFLCPKGTAVELYATTLHYAPCSARKGEGFRVVIVLPKGTNEDAPEIKVTNDNDKYLWARNKWLIAHPDSAEAADGAQAGITGENVDIIDLI
jgi:ureidoglycolate hydrolase